MNGPTLLLRESRDGATEDEMGTRKRRKAMSRSARVVARHADRILKEAAGKARELEEQGRQSVTLSRDELIRKLSGKTAHSPFLTQVGYPSVAVRGSPFGMLFGVLNPDPFPYAEGYIALCVYWGIGAGLADPEESLLLADKALGVLAVEVGFLDVSASPSPYFLSLSFVVPTNLAPGSTRSDLNYLLYRVNAFQDNVLLERGSLSLPIT